MATFDDILPRLVATYESGRLVPFLGSGMSVPVCRDWWTFVHGLESAVAGHAVAPYPKEMTRDELIRRANAAVRALKAGARGSFEPALRKALLADDPEPPIPDQTRALAGVPWPLVLTTNYDNCFAAALRRHAPTQPLAVVGRSSEDCQRVLNSLSVAGRAIYWALQGYLDAPYQLDTSMQTQRLRDELVVGHEEYRRVTYRDLHFRRAFAEVFRQRSLFFLGAGIQEVYLQDLFGEVLEYYGPGTRPHYAIIPRGEVDPEFMLARFQVVVVEYEKGHHQDVVDHINRFAEAVTLPARTPVTWTWGRTIRDDGHWKSVADLEVVRGPLPTAWAKHECLALSAGGGEGSYFFSEGIQKVKGQWGVPLAAQPTTISTYLGEFVNKDVFAVRARTETDERDLSSIYRASLDLFEHVAPRYQRIRMQLLAAGGLDKIDAPAGSAWKLRNYPERFSFIQSVRAWGEYRRTHPDLDCVLSLHVVLDSVYHDVASGRIDVLELLSCRDLRFFAEVVADNGDIERRLFQLLPDTALGDVVRQLQLSPTEWEFDVTPPPSLDPPRREPLLAHQLKTIGDLGVVPGSTIHFHRFDASGADRAAWPSRA